MLTNFYDFNKWHNKYKVSFDEIIGKNWQIQYQNGNLKKKILNIGKPTGIKFNKRKFYLKIKLQLIWKLQFKFDLLNSENNSQIIMYLLIV